MKKTLDILAEKLTEISSLESIESTKKHLLTHGLSYDVYISESINAYLKGKESILSLEKKKILLLELLIYGFNDIDFRYIQVLIPFNSLSQIALRDLTIK